MIELCASDWYTVTGRGQMAAVNLRDVPSCPERINNESQIPLRVGQHVYITDHGEYEIRGIEYATALISPPFIKPHACLQLRPIPANPSPRRPLVAELGAILSTVEGLGTVSGPVADSGRGGNVT